MTKLSILGIPFDANSSFMRGAAEGPDAIRRVLHDGSANYWSQGQIDLGSLLKKADEGNLSFNSDDPLEANRLIEEGVTRILEKGHRLISLGGDHSIIFPIIRAYARKYPQLHILQIDAHSDLYDELGGNPYSHACPFARIMEEKLARSLTQIGVRTLNAHQMEQAGRFDVSIIEMKDFNPKEELRLEGPLYISLDLDAFDPAFAPGVSHHEPGGFTSREILTLIGRIKVPIIGADIVELNPGRDPVGITAMLGAKLLKEFVEKITSE